MGELLHNGRVIQATRDDFQTNEQTYGISAAMRFLRSSYRIWVRPIREPDTCRYLA